MKNLPAAMQLLIVGLYVPFSLFLPMGIGFWFDRRASHEFPLYSLIGLGVGTIIMVYGVYQMVRPFLNEAKKLEKEQQVRKAERKENSAALHQTQGNNEKEG